MQLIDLDDLKHRCDNPEYTLYNGEMAAEWLRECIKSAPIVDAEPVRHGRWIEKSNTIQCSNCGKEYNDEIHCMCFGEGAELNRCPKCGAKMDV